MDIFTCHLFPFFFYYQLFHFELSVSILHACNRVIISLLKRYSRAFISYYDLFDGGLLLTDGPKSSGEVEVEVSHWQFLGSHDQSIGCYWKKICLSIGILTVSFVWQHLPQFKFVSIRDLFLFDLAKTFQANVNGSAPCLTKLCRSLGRVF